MNHRIAFVCALVLGCSAFAAPPSPVSSYQRQKEQAEKLFADGSYQRAHDAYAAVDPAPLPSAEKRWVAFRLLDSEWRAAAGSSQRDPVRLNDAQAKLTQLVAAAPRAEDHDRVWAEAQESLGDFYWIRPDSRNFYQGWQYYQLALDWWAGADADLELARQRYIAICWRIARPPAVEAYYSYGYYGNRLGTDVLTNLLEIVRTDDDKAHAHYLMAMSLKDQGGDPEQLSRVSEEFEAALKLGKKTDWYDDALYSYATYLESYGRPVQDDQGNWSSRPDYVGALKLYRRFLAEMKKGESRWYDNAKSQAENIVAPQLSVGVSNVFLPDSQMPYSLSWRNVTAIDLSLYAVNLAEPAFRSSDSSSDWLERLDLGASKRVRSWTQATHDKKDYRPGSSEETLEKLPVGAYVLEASGKGSSGKTLKSRDLVLVTRTSLVVKSAPGKTLLWMVDASTGEPRKGAKTTLWTHHSQGDRSWWTHAERPTDADGIAAYPRKTDDSSTGELYAAAASQGDQAFSPASSPSRASYQEGWKIYAFTDRPAYRPGEKAQWKIIARVYNRETYQTPANQKVHWRITDPQGSLVAESDTTLNAFGTAWGELALTDKMPLGEYRIEFSNVPGGTIGDAVLLRLEEYKLPEFTVSVKTPEVEGRHKTYHLGEKVTAEVQVDYYFGGAVADADVQLLVYQNPTWARWEPPREYPWFYADMNQSPGYYGYGGSIIKQDRVRTDATGKVQVTFDTPRGAGQDYEYRIEARVTDSSRREVSGSGTVRVTRQDFYAFLTPQHTLFQPADRVAIDARTLDANDQPYPAEAAVSITRDWWTEVWTDPAGKDVTGEELSRLTRTTPGFASKGYTLKSQGYNREPVETRKVKTDAKGEAEIDFTPQKEGYYQIRWSTPQKGRAPVEAETWVWVARASTTEMGYRHGGLEVLIDKDTVRPGAIVPVMITVPTPDRWVLFSVESSELHQYQVVHLTGTVKLLQVKMEDAFVPNVYLQADMVRDQQLFEDTKQIVVPPTQHYLTVGVEPDKKEYQPRETGSWTVTARDDTGKPVAAEVALSVVDESVYAIQDELAGDPRQFYFGTKRSQVVGLQSTFNQKSYARLTAAPPQPAPVVQPGTGGADRGEADDLRREGPALATGSAPGMAPPAAAKAPMDMPMKNKAGLKDAEDKKEVNAEAQGHARASNGAPGPQAPVVVRSDFRSTAFWGPHAVTDPTNGKARITLKYPDSLTGWRATARVVSRSAQFGIATSPARTRMPMLVRLEGPRFYVVGDETTVSAVVNNNTEHPLSARVELEAKGLEVMSGGAPTLKVLPHGEARADWVVKVKAAGEAGLKVVARSGELSDAMEKSFPAYEHGVDKLIARSGKMRGSSVEVKLDLPPERREGSTQLTVEVAPSMAVALLDALPYLIDYPYGCTEQTLSRFLPAVMVRKTLVDLGVDPKKLMNRSFGGIEASSASKTHPEGKRSLAELDGVTADGLKRLYDFQHGDGGWGWWKDGESDRFMSAYVLWGLSQARDAKVEVRDDVMSRAADYLAKELVSEETNPDRQAWLLNALSAYWAPMKRSSPGAFEKKAFDNLWKVHPQMNAYTRALFALTAFRYGYLDQARTLATNLENGVERDDTPDTSVVMEGAQSSDPSVMGTAHWGQDGFWWRWSDSAIETTAFAIQALVTIDPRSPLIEPAVNWMVKNRRGAQWTNTRDTAISVLALTDYLKQSGELGGAMEYALTVNGHQVARKKLTRDDALGAPSRFTVDASRIRDANEIRLERLSGTGALYFSAEARFFSLEEPIAPAGHEIFVRRKYFKKVGRKTLLKGWVYDRQPLEDGGQVQSGDRVEVVVTVETKNDYEYLLFEDLKPAGLEAVEVKSGQPMTARAVTRASFDRNYGKLGPDGKRTDGLGASTDDIDYTGEQRPIYQELRDRQVAMFADKLPQGVWEMRYELRAEVPGKFHALPLMAEAMYIPEIRANSAEVRLEVTEAPKER